MFLDDVEIRGVTRVRFDTGAEPFRPTAQLILTLDVDLEFEGTVNLGAVLEPRRRESRRAETSRG